MYDELIVFDFDFTIAKTVEHIWVWSPRGNSIHDGKTYRKVHPTQLQQSGLSDDEEINEDSFIEFYSLDLSKTKLIQPILPYLKYYSNTDKVNILTARPQSIKNEVFIFLQSNNINIDNINFIGLANSFFEKKVEWINTQIRYHKFNKLILFEDNIKLIEHMLKRCIITNKSLYYINNYSNKTIITYYE